MDVQVSGFEQVRACLFISTGKLQSVVKLFVIFIPVRLNRLHISCPESIPSKSDLLSTDVEHHCTDDVHVQVLHIHVDMDVQTWISVDVHVAVRRMIRSATFLN